MERYLRIYCPAHKVSFSVVEAHALVCAAGGETLAHEFPREEFWEYCCDCQSFWPSSLARGGKAAELCLVCERKIERRFICDKCKVISLESGEETRRKAFTVKRGFVEPACPGCSGLADSAGVRSHDCEEINCEFNTTRVVCPFCEDQIADLPSFPLLASEYLAKSRTKQLLCRFDASENLLIPSPEGNLTLLPSGNGTRLSIVVPHLTRFSTKQEFFSNYKDVYDCDEPGAGEVFIIYPAVADKTDEGWKLRELGRLRVKREEPPVAEVPQEPPAAEQGYSCPNCHTQALPEHEFCKECGHHLAAETSPVPEAEFWQAPSLNVNQESPAATPQKSSNKALAVLVGIAVCLALALAVMAAVVFSGRARNSSAESKLEDAIARGNLVSPQGDCAYDYYQQLKREGANRNTLSKFENRVLPLLSSRPQALIDAWTKPDGKDASSSEWDEAYRMLSWASEIDPKDSSLAARASYCQGRAAYLNKQMDEAINLWKRAGDLNRSWALPAKDIGYVYLKDKNFTLARDFFNESMSRDKGWAVPQLFMGDTYYLQKFYSDAQSYYEEAARLAPQWARAHAALGELAKVRGNDYLKQTNSYMARAEFQKAEQELELALELGSKNPGNFNRKGVDDSLRDVRRALESLGDGEEE